MSGKLDVPLSNQTALDRPTIDGIRLKARWKDIETSPGAYNWANLDGAIAQVTSKGKKCGIEINAGFECPLWLYSGPEIPTHSASYVLQDGRNAGGTIPVPGDTIFISRWCSFITALGVRYNSNQSLSYVAITGPGNHDEWNLAQGPNDTAALGDTQAKVDIWTTEVKTFIDAFCNAFPSTVCFAVLAKPFQNAIGYPAMIAAVDYGVANHTPQFGLSFNALSANSNPGYEPVNQIVLHWATNPTWAQMLSGNSNPDELGVPASEGLDQSLRSAVDNKIRGVEIYKTDCDNPSKYSYFAPAGATWQSNNVSGTPAGINPRRTELLAIPNPMITLAGNTATVETVTLTWTGALGATVDIYRDGVLFSAAVPNNGTFVTTETGAGIGVSHVWEVRGNTASNDVTLV